MNQLAYAISRRLDGSYAVWARNLRSQWMLVTTFTGECAKDRARKYVYEVKKRRLTAIKQLARTKLAMRA